MDQVGLETTITFLQSLGFSRDDHLPLRKVYEALEEKTGMDFSSTTYNFINDAVKKNTNTMSEPREPSNILNELERLAGNSASTNDEMIEILKAAKSKFQLRV